MRLVQRIPFACFTFLSRSGNGQVSLSELNDYYDILILRDNVFDVFPVVNELKTPPMGFNRYLLPRAFVSSA